MPAPAKYPSAHVQLFRLAVIARRRGLAFDSFWREALRPRTCGPCEIETLLSICPQCGRRCHGGAIVTVIDTWAPATVVRFPTDTADKRAAVYALDSTREGWRRAYDREPTIPSEQAFRLLAPLLAQLDLRQAGGIEPEAAVA